MVSWRRFAWTGAGRLVVAAITVVAATLLTTLLVPPGIVALFGGTVVYGLFALTIAPALARAAALGQWPFFAGSGPTPAWVLRKLAMAGLAGFLAGVPLVLLLGVSDDLSARGGAGAIFLTLALLALALVAVSAVARLAVSAIAWRWGWLRGLLGLVVRRRWDSVEAAVALVAVLAAAYAIGLGYAGAVHRGDVVDARGEPVEPLMPTERLDRASAQSVLAAFAPALDLTAREGWYPQRVDAYLAGSRVVDRQGRTVVTAASLAAVGALTCPRDDGTAAVQTCFVIDDPACPRSAACQESRFEPGRAYADPGLVAYARLATRDGAEATGWASIPQWATSPFGDELWAVAQYWLFAPYDEWRAPIGLLAGEVVQRHDADWEAVTIGLSRTGPLFVALSGHCGGVWRRWPDVQVSAASDPAVDPLGPRLHVVAADADGSHAMYFDSIEGRAPDASGCRLARAAGWLELAGYAANLRDRTGGELRLQLGVATAEESRVALTAPVAWSIEEEIRVETPLGGHVDRSGSVADPKGPGAPLSQPLGHDPLRTIFCDGRWRYDGPGATPAAPC